MPLPPPVTIWAVRHGPGDPSPCSRRGRSCGWRPVALFDSCGALEVSGTGCGERVVRRLAAASPTDPARELRVSGRKARYLAHRIPYTIQMHRILGLGVFRSARVRIPLAYDGSPVHVRYGKLPAGHSAAPKHHTTPINGTWNVFTLTCNTKPVRSSCGSYVGMDASAPDGSCMTVGILVAHCWEVGPSQVLCRPPGLAC